MLAFALFAAALLLWTPDQDRALLEQRYLASPADLVAVDGRTLHVRDDGPPDAAAPAIVFVHGFGASLHTWEPWAQALKDDFRVVRFDLPGSGLSAPDPDRDYGDARSVALLAALMDRLGLARAHVVGHSIGGRIAWAFAARHPARVDRLVLVAPDGFASPGFEYGQAPEVPAGYRLMRHVLPRPLLRMSLAPAYGDPAALSDAVVQRYHDLITGPGVRDALLDRMAQTVLVEPSPTLRLIAAPTLLIWGDRDAVIPIANADGYLAAIDGATLAVIAGVGHVPQEEDAAVGLAALRRFLDGARRR